MTDETAQLEEYFRSVRAVDAPRASDFVLQMFDEGTPVQRITAEVLGPAQKRVGELWQDGEWSVADEHAATAVTEAAVLALEQAARPRGGALQQRHIVVACVEGEWHTLPARMAAVVAASPGTRVTVLGPSLPADQLSQRLSNGDVDLLALSCTMPTSLLGAARGIAIAHEHDVPVLVGGRAFGDGPMRAEAIGADSWSNDPAALLQPSPARTGRSSEPSLEVLVLDAVDGTVVEVACDRLMAAFPKLVTMPSPPLPAELRRDFVSMARYTAAALLTSDHTIVDEYLHWLCSLFEDRVPPEVITAAALLLADAVDADAPRGAEMLRQAAGRLASTTGER